MRAHAWLLSLPEAERVETAAFMIEQLTGGSTRADWIRRHLKVQPRLARLAAVLESRQGKTVTREALMAAIWLEHADEVGVRSLDVVLTHLRRALPPGAIETVRGEGYRLVQPLPVPPMPAAESLDAIAARQPLPVSPWTGARQYMPWTSREDRDLRRAFARRKSLMDIALAMGRTERAVRLRIAILGLRR